MRLSSLSPLASLTARARAFVYQNADLIDDLLRPSLRGMRDDLRRLDGDAAAVLLENFRRSSYAWEMYFWCSLAERWIIQSRSLDDALKRTSDDIVELGRLLDDDEPTETGEDGPH